MHSSISWALALGSILLAPAALMGQSTAHHEAPASASSSPPAVHAPAGTNDAHSPAVATSPATVAAPAISHADAIVAEMDKLPPNDEEAIQSLMDGNYRFVDGVSKHPRMDASRVSQTAIEGQKPFATILTCSDSRVPPELLFDQGIGDLFVIRVAGNVISPDEAGSIEYGVGHLHTPLLVVLGHTGCGAVTAAAQHAHVEGNVQQLLDRIQPAVAAAQQQDPNLSGNALVAAAIRENVWNSIEELLKSSGEMRQLVVEDKVRIVGAIYDIRTGNVRWLGRHPRQEQIIDQAAAGGDGPAHEKPVTPVIPQTPAVPQPAAASPAHGTTPPARHDAPAAPQHPAAPADSHGGHSAVDDASQGSASASIVPSAANAHEQPAHLLAEGDAHASRGEQGQGHSPATAGQGPHEGATADPAGHVAQGATEATSGEPGDDQLANRLREKFAAQAEHDSRNAHNVIYISAFLGVAGIGSAVLIHRIERSA